MSPVPVVYVGTPGVSRKAVIHLVHPASGTCDAIVKVPLTDAAQAAILREADVLATLADEGYTCAPRLLYVDQDRGVTTQTVAQREAGRPEVHHRALGIAAIADTRGRDHDHRRTRLGVAGTTVAGSAANPTSRS